ncbi:uncharacterized protein JCM10292_001239 [Rhodotorula paludigena]|uniref:uncharacterized protein n=1 Tax=Rhodotorula paludigena TaxID=86838 RepID=UPI00317BFDE1
MATIDTLPAVAASLGASLESLPAALTSVNTTLLSSLLSAFSSDLEPVLPSLGTAQREQLLSNTTWLAENTAALASIASKLPPADAAASSHETLLALIKIAVTKYDVFSLYSCDVWSALFLFILAILFKAALALLLSPSAIRRTRTALEDQYGGEVDRDFARARLQKPARALLGHLMNLVVSTAALVFQLMAYRLFALPGQPVTFDDFVYFSIALKLIIFSYAADLLFGDVRPEIYAHHFFTFALLFVGQMAVFETKSPKFFRMAQWLILQATTEQSTYAAMVSYHALTYLKVQDHRPKLQRRLLAIAHKLLVFTKYITWVQKVAPAAFSLYWLGRMWYEIDDIAWGRAWLGWSSLIIALLLLLQIKFCDDIFPLANYVGYKLNGGDVPSRTGPVMRILLRLIGRRARRASAPTPERAPRSSAGIDLERGAEDAEKSAGQETEWEFVKAVDSQRSSVLSSTLPELSRSPGQATLDSSASSSRTFA